jgi:hypothetical protein
VDAALTSTIDRFPDESTLVQRVGNVAGGPIVVVARTPFASGTFPKEIITYRTPDDGDAGLFCKYEAARPPAFGHRGGIDYEARVYREVLAPIDVTAPQLLASGREGSRPWLILALVAGQRLSEDYERMPEAARWAARFHALNSDRVGDTSLRWLTAYDDLYYHGWCDRTLSFAEGRPESGRWLSDVGSWFRAHVSALTDTDQTIIHGEYTIHNVMVTGDTIVPTDWESAAVGPGEIDLMSVVDRWPVDVVDRCVAAYVGARWPVGAPINLDQRLLMAELYLHFRWLGEDPALMLGPKRVWRFERLLELADRIASAP